MIQTEPVPSRKRIAFISQGLGRIVPPVAEGSISIWTYETARHLSHAHSVILIEFGQTLLRPYASQHEGAEYVFLPTAWNRIINGVYKRTSGFVRRFWSQKKQLLRPPYASIFHNLGYCLHAAWQVRRWSARIIHLHNFSQFVPVVRILNPRARVVLHMNCEWLSQHDSVMIARRLKSADAVICCSGHVRRKLLQRFPAMESKAHIVYNGGNVERFVPSIESVLVNPPAPLRILFVGRISPEKGVHLLVSAFVLMASRFPTAELHLVGSIGSLSADFLVALSDDPNVRSLEPLCRGDYLANIKGRIPENLHSRVIFHGSQSHDQLQEHYRKATIFVISSLSDAFPLTVVEAMAAGLPVVGSAVGGIPEAVQHETTGLLVAPNNPEALAEGLSRLLGDSELRGRMAKAGRERALRCFSYKAIADQLSAVYSRIEGGHAPAKDPLEAHEPLNVLSVTQANHAINSN
jgi:spore coat protein SA